MSGRGVSRKRSVTTGRNGSKPGFDHVGQVSATSCRSEVLTDPSIAAVQRPTEKLGVPVEDDGRKHDRSIVLTAKLIFLATGRQRI
jgi:hypothetical protein